MLVKRKLAGANTLPADRARCWFELCNDAKEDAGLGRSKADIVIRIRRDTFRAERSGTVELDLPLQCQRGTLSLCSILPDQMAVLHSRVVTPRVSPSSFLCRIADL